MSQFTILLAAALVAAPAATIAQPAVEVTNTVDRAVVSFADLNLASAAGRRLLNRRLSGAIEDVCGSFAGVRDEREERGIAACRSSAWQSANRQLAVRSSTQRLALSVAR